MKKLFCLLALIKMSFISFSQPIAKHDDAIAFNKMMGIPITKSEIIDEVTKLL
jgi:hypothetical protein